MNEANRLTKICVIYANNTETFLFFRVKITASLYVLIYLPIINKPEVTLSLLYVL